jgi:hypothetical protein
MQALPVSNGTQLPRAVIRGSARVAQLEAERKARAEEAAPAPAATDVTPSAGTESQPAAQPAPEPPSTPPNPRDADPVYWQQRFHTVQGLLDSVKRDRAAERAKWNLERDQLQARILELEQVSAAQPEAIDISAFFTPEQIEKYGEEQCQVMATAAVHAAKTSVQATVEAQLKPLREQAKRTQEQRTEELMDAFLERLTALVPDYASFDERDDWKAWLADDDEMSGEQRQSILHRHIQRFDEMKTAAMFEAFRKTLQAPPSPPVTASKTGEGSTPTPPAPPTGGSGAPTQAEIKDFYKRAKLGKLKDGERVAFEARLRLLPPA